MKKRGRYRNPASLSQQMYTIAAAEKSGIYIYIEDAEQEVSLAQWPAVAVCLRYHFFSQQ